MNEITTIQGIGCYEKDGVAYLNLEACARGLGFTKKADSGNEVVHWTRVRGYLKDLGVVHECTTGDFIPENIFYRLAMKAKNETAEKFQALVADDVIPSIRRHGAYMTPATIEQVLSNPDFIIGLATRLKDAQETNAALAFQITQKNQLIGEMKPKADYVDWILQNPGLVTITQIAKDYGMSGAAMNALLSELHVQYKQSGQWLLYRKHHGMGYTHSETVPIVHTDGREDTKMNTKWTQKGRLFVYELLKGRDVLPTIEKKRKAS